LMVGISKRWEEKPENDLKILGGKKKNWVRTRQKGTATPLKKKSCRLSGHKALGGDHR